MYVDPEKNCYVWRGRELRPSWRHFLRAGVWGMGLAMVGNWVIVPLAVWANGGTLWTIGINP